MDTNSQEEKKDESTNVEAPPQLTPRRLKAQRREEILDKIFGTYRPGAFENIWGNTLPKVGFVLVVVLSIFAYWGTQKGVITWEKTDADLPSFLQSKKTHDSLHQLSKKPLEIDNKDTKKD